MLFNSLDFLVFFPVVALLYYLSPVRHRWFVLLLASYVFYGWWNVRYSALILFSTLVDYMAGIRMSAHSEKAKRRVWLAFSLVANLGVLFLFKYFNFFNEAFRDLFLALRMPYMVPALEVLLPVGISFYTFQTLSYTIDLYRGRIALPERHFGRFALFVSFFPQLVAGPIERATSLLPQFHRDVRFSHSRLISGLRLMLWGFFKKIVIADRLGIFVSEVYGQPRDYHGLTLVVATVFFAFQIYCDFSGYSDIAIGAARILGFELMQNFRTPYFAATIREFWQRWHISLSTWFRDYLYIPLGGNRVPRWRWHFNLLITYVVSGLWHGAAWTFVVWGALHGLYYFLESRFKFGELVASWPRRTRNLVGPTYVFTLVCLSWVFFRAESLSDAAYILSEIARIPGYSTEQLGLYVVPAWKGTVYALDIALGWGWIALLVVAERASTRGLAFGQLPARIRFLTYLVGVYTILLFGVFEKNEFIYFQF